MNRCTIKKELLYTALFKIQYIEKHYLFIKFSSYVARNNLVVLILIFLMS